MPKRAVACIVAVAAVAALVGQPLTRPSGALAAATLLSDAPVLAEPDQGAAAVGWLPAGTAVAVDGPPVAGFYPIRAETVAGWAPAASLLLEPPDAMAQPPAASGSIGAGPRPPNGVTATPIPHGGPLGPAIVAAEAPILAGPGTAFGLIATAPAGSIVEQTGHLIDGYVTVRYAEVTGWAPLDRLGPPPTAG